MKKSIAKANVPLKERLENHLGLVAASIMLASFLAGIGCYESILRISHLEVNQSGKVAELQSEIDRLNGDPTAGNAEAKRLRDELDNALTKIDTLTADLRNIEEERGSLRTRLEQLQQQMRGAPTQLGLLHERIRQYDVTFESALTRLEQLALGLRQNVRNEDEAAGDLRAITDVLRSARHQLLQGVPQ